MKKLKSIIMEYEDGTQNKIELNNLDSNVQSALAGSGLCAPSDSISSARSYLILQWKDGWKEVIAINSDVADLIRFYVIRRIEDRGRLALDVGEAYPVLRIIERLPDEISRIHIINEKKVKSYVLGSSLEGYEGVFEAGGKKEYKKYERSHPYFKEACSESPENFTQIKDTISASLKKKGMDPEKIMLFSPEDRVQIYREIAESEVLKGAERQSDVYGFIELVLKNLKRSE